MPSNRLKLKVPGLINGEAIGCVAIIALTISTICRVALAMMLASVVAAHLF